MLEEANGDRYSFSKVFKFQNFLGTGTFGFVVSAIEKATGEVLALKIVDATQQNPMHSLQKEAEILQSLPTHDNIIEYKFLKEYTNYVIMGLEYARAGTLLNLQRGYIHNRKHIKDEDCSKIIKGILLGLKHLSRHDIVHRDLKPSNIVLTDADQLDKVKLVDFGLAVKYQTRQGMDETCGTLVYQAPEQMAGGQCYGKAVDVWAAGFIMYELIAGKHPLWEKGDSNAAYKAKALNFTKLKYGRRFNKLSQGLLEKLCHPKPSLRYTVDQALQHPWITRNFQGEIPRNHFEQSMYLNDTDDKFRKIMHLVFTLSVFKNQDIVQANKSMRLQIKQEKTAQPTPTKNGSSDLANERSGSAISKIKSCDDIKPGILKEGENNDTDGSDDDGSFNRQITPFFQQNNKGKAKEIEEQFGLKRASQISQRTDASKFDAMDSYLIGNMDKPSPIHTMERNKNKKMLEVNIEINSKKGKIRMDTSIGETSGFKSDLTPRDRGIGEGYTPIAGFASRNQAKAKQSDSLTMNAVDQSVIKSITSKNLGGNSIGSKPSSQRSLISLKQINSTSMETNQFQALKPPLGDASATKLQGQKDNSRTQRSFRIGKFQTKKQHDIGSGLSPADPISGSGEVNYFQDMNQTDESPSPLKSSLLDPIRQSFGSSTNEIDSKMQLASPRIGPENTRNILLISQDVPEPIESRGFQSLNPITQSTQIGQEDILKLPYQQIPEKKEYRRKLVSSNAMSTQNQSLQDGRKISKVMLSEEKKDKVRPQSKSKSDITVSNSKTNTRLKESASGSDFDRSANEGSEPLVLKRTVEGQFTPVKVNIREIKKKKAVQTTTKKDRVNKNPHKVRVQTQIKRLSSKQGTLPSQTDGHADKSPEPSSTILQSPEFNENKQLGESESSRTQSTPALLTNDNSMLDDGGNKLNESLQQNNYNQASVKFKRKLIKANNTPTTVNDPENMGSNPTTPCKEKEPFSGLERDQGSSFNSRSELRQGQPTIDQDQSMIKKPYAKSQLNEFAAQMKNRSSSFIEKNRNIIQNGYPTQLSNMQQQMAQTGGMSNPIKLSQMKSEIMTNQQKFRLSMNSQIPKNGNKSQIQTKPNGASNGAYYNNSNYEIIKHDGPAPPNPRGAQGSPSSYVNAMPIRGLERFGHLAQPYAFKENGELRDNALNQYVQYQQYRAGPTHKGSTGSTRLQSTKGQQLLSQSGTASSQKAGQQPPGVQGQVLSKSPMLMSNFKLITDGAPLLLPNNAVYPAQGAVLTTDQAENVPTRQASFKTSLKPEGSKAESGADFSPFESFLLNLLQKNNDEQQLPTQGAEPGPIVSVVGKSKPVAPVVSQQTHNTYSNIPAKRLGSQSESRNVQTAQGGSEASPDKNRVGSLKKGTIGLSNINFKF